MYLVFPVSLDFVEGQTYCRLGPCKSTLPCDLLTEGKLTGMHLPLCISIIKGTVLYVYDD